MLLSQRIEDLLEQICGAVIDMYKLLLATEKADFGIVSLHHDQFS